MAYQLMFTHQYLEIAGVPLSTPAWEVLNLHTLLSGPAIRGENVLIPGAAGVRPRRRRIGETIRTLELHIFGDQDPEGAEHADHMLGLMQNIETLRDLVTDPPADNHSVVTAVLHWRGETRTAGVQVVGFEVGEAVGETVRATIDLVIPSGGFA